MTLTVPLKRPRPIRSEVVDIGDDIAVELKPSGGIRVTKRGVVGIIQRIGMLKYYSTVEGSVLFVTEPGKPDTFTLTVYGRHEYVQDAMFSMDDEILQRIA